MRGEGMLEYLLILVLVAVVVVALLTVLQPEITQIIDNVQQGLQGAVN
ncbi:MAG: pilus assembly protein [Anaerolineales bacterium]|nr:pilus assembly protein [Anaerolineales bacterium]MCB9127053.1 pilus assembly protein [Ardenticatenales bacterium]MCB9172422.1 pilus assembly protein [Ardenticatenales bacterium]